MKILIPHNLTQDCVKTITAGYYKYGAKTLLDWGGATGTIIIEVYVNKDNDNEIPSRME